MSSPVFGADGVQNVLRGALDGLSLRQSVIADDIANVDTPHFRARSVDFEAALRAAIAGGEPQADLGAGLEITTSPTQTPVGSNDNNVDLRKETMAAMQSLFQYQAVTRAVSDRAALVRTAAGAA